MGAREGRRQAPGAHLTQFFRTASGAGLPRLQTHGRTPSVGEFAGCKATQDRGRRQGVLPCDEDELGYVSGEVEVDNAVQEDEEELGALTHRREAAASL